MHNKFKIIILAAGKGKRMKTDAPKALTPFKGKPFIRHILDTIKQIDPKIKPIIVIGYQKELVKETVGDECIYAEQNEQLGTGHAVMSARGVIDKEAETILVISADQPTVSKETLNNIISVHKNKKSIITLATAVIPDFEDWRVGFNHLGRIIRGDDGSVKKIVEFKDANENERKEKELNLALYVFDTKWLWSNISKIKNENVQTEYYLTDLVKIACDQREKVEAVQITNIIEAIHPNSKEELDTLEMLSK